jgi:hypothetical protein
MMNKLVAVGLAVIAFNLWLFGQTWPSWGEFGFAFQTIIVMGLSWLAFWHQSPTRNHRVAGVTTGLAVLAAGLSVTRASDVDQMLLGSLSYGLQLTTVYLLALTHDRFGAITELLRVPLRLMGEWVLSLVKLFDILPKMGMGLAWVGRWINHRWKLPHHLSGGVGRGLIVGVPVALVIAMLLMGADPIFADFVKHLFDFTAPNWHIKLSWRLVESLVFLIGVAPIALMKISDQFRSPLAKKYGHFSVEMITISSIVGLVMASFLFIQFRYIFVTVSETQLHQFGVNTYSEYARKGFGELLVVSVLLYSLAGAGMVVARTAVKQVKALRYVNLFLLGEAVIFIFSVLRRVLLYQDAHGLTRIRVYGSGFLMMLLVLTLLLVWRQFGRRVQQWYLWEIGTVIAATIILSTMNVDRLIAVHFPPTVNAETDYVYISRLSADAVDGWILAYRHHRSVILDLVQKDPATWTDDDRRQLYYSKIGLDRLNLAYTRLMAKEDKLNRSWNLAESEAQAVLVSEIDHSELLYLMSSANVLFSQSPQEAQPRVYDRSLDSPLLSE